MQIDEPQIEALKIWALKRGGRIRNGKRDPSHQDYGQPLSRDAAQSPPVRPSQTETIKTVPEIEQYTKDEGAERETDYVFSEEAYLDWIGNVPNPCAPPQSLARHSGICRGEMLHLMKDCVRLYPMPIAGRLFGSLGDQTRFEAAGVQAPWRSTPR